MGGFPGPHSQTWNPGLWFPLPEGGPCLSHTLSGQERDPSTARPAASRPPSEPDSRLPSVIVQVEGRSQPGGPRHHCFLQSEGEAGGVSGRVSQPSLAAGVPWGGPGEPHHGPLGLSAGPFGCPVAALPPSRSSSPAHFSLLPLLLFLFPIWVWAGGGWGKLPRSLCCGASKQVPCPSSHLRAQRPAPLMPTLVCWGNGTRRSESRAGLGMF